jgi:sigma-54 specific flagellar transcriptional regulator A
MASGEWDHAERNFGDDAHTAAAAGDREAELRALLNRATALVGAGRTTEARALLESILDRAAEVGSARANAFALSNLAVMASRGHDYAAALAYRERAIVAFRRIGNRTWLARSMIYLADLRVDLGLVSEADQALAFARQVLGPSIPPTQAAWMSLVLSRIHMERGNVGRAVSEIDAALAAAERSTDGSMLGDCHCQAVRIALAEADVARASAHLARARDQSGAAREGELALLEARLAEARHLPFADQARRALMVTRGAKDRARMIEAHRLLERAATVDGDPDRATLERESAALLEQAIAASLPAHLRAGFGARAWRLESLRSEPPKPQAPARGRRPSRQRHGMIGSHPSMLQMFEVLGKVAATDATAMVLGESGTGKELIAEALHQQSGRSGGPLVKVNCAALVETLLLSELFGHEKGAFTGATSQRQGCFEHADGGTIFLDEIGDISPATQSALLRVLQDQTFHRVGGTKPVRVDVRVICATHRDLQAMVASGAFREDLYYRLSGIVVAVPPLRDRIEDLPLLASDVLLRLSQQSEIPHKRLDEGAVRVLATHRWPGNVRELENVLRAVALFSEGATITADDVRRHAPALGSPALSSSALSSSARSYAPTAAASSAATGEAGDGEEETTPQSGLAEPSHAPEDVVYRAVREGAGLRELQKRLEHECVVRALDETGGHVTRAAALLGIKRPRLSQLIKHYNLRAVEGDE